MNTTIVVIVAAIILYKLFPRTVKAVLHTAWYLLTKRNSGKGRDKNTQTVSDINKEKGDAFEKFVIMQFDPIYFQIREWRSDKIVNGIYALSNHSPDIEINFHLKDFSRHFAIECKYRQRLYKNQVELAKEHQLANYKKFMAERNIPVYIALGMGGKPERPMKLFLIPLQDIDSPAMDYKDLLQYERPAQKQFFYNRNMDNLE